MQFLIFQVVEQLTDLRLSKNINFGFLRLYLMANRSKKVKFLLGGLMKLIEELRVVLGGQHVLI